MGSGEFATEASQLTSVSVIIPTFNRKESLLRTLESLEQQSYPVDRLEVIVVDDGGSDGTETILGRGFKFSLHYMRQENQGATAARNHGALQSNGEFLIFVDDDMRLLSRTIECLSANGNIGKAILLGTLTTPHEILDSSVFARLGNSGQPLDSTSIQFQQVPFQNCMTGLLGLRHDDFFALGMFQDPTGGWPNWDDVDFGYRAHQAGYQLLRIGGAIAEHWDYALLNLNSACRRLERASFSGATLLWRYPALNKYLPMFADKGPISLQQDPPRLILYKLARQIVSSAPAMWCMKHLIPLLERYAQDSRALRSLYSCIISGYIYHGYRQGLRKLMR